MTSLLDNNLCRQLAKLVETLTHTGQKTLDKDLLKKIKNICRTSDGYVEHAYHLVIYQLQKEHAEIRFSAFQICDELFRRSHCFRELLISNLQHVMELTCETSDRPLPPPRSVALNLKRLALQTLQDWNKKFGEGYKKLQLGYNFLKHCKKVDFNAIRIENAAEQARREELNRRQAVINEEKMKKVTLEMSELEPEILNTLTALENCIALLLPTPEDFFIQEGSKRCDDDGDGESLHNTKYKLESSEHKSDTENDIWASTSRADDSSMEIENTETSASGTENINFREHGIVNSKYSIVINVNKETPTIKESAENAAIFENARDMYTLIKNRYLPSVKKWVQTITKASVNSDELKKVINMKEKLEKAAERYLQLKACSVPESGSESSDSDFEEVKEKEGYEEVAREEFALPATSTTKAKTINQPAWSIWSEENNELDPTSAQSTLSAIKSTKPVMCQEKEKVVRSCTIVKEDMEPIPSTSKEDPSPVSQDSRKAKLLAVAPKIPFDIDLYHWEDENVKVPMMVAVRAEGSRFWHSTQEELEEVPVPDGVKSIRTRVIEFTGKFEPVQWSCRAPLPNGKLCPRRDRYKCPFHGPIVARDKMGQCSNPEDAKKLAQLEEEKNVKCPDWQDPQLLEDIKNATGMDLKIPEKNKGKGKKKKDKNKYPGLTDIKAKQNTSYTRISKKIFKRGAVKKVAQYLDAQDHKRFRDKYGDQFHYMYNTA